jgi:uncharacterized membrane protein YciS (DUF1049 family)
MIRLLVLLVLCLFLLMLDLKNSGLVASLNYFFGVTRPIPVAWLITGAFAAGLLLGWLFVMPGWVRLKLELRRQRRTQDRLEEELSLHRKPTEAEDIKIRTPPEPDEF